MAQINMSQRIVSRGGRGRGEPALEQVTSMAEGRAWHLTDVGSRSLPQQSRVAFLVQGSEGTPVRVPAAERGCGPPQAEAQGTQWQALCSVSNVIHFSKTLPSIIPSTPPSKPEIRRGSSWPGVTTCHLGMSAIWDVRGGDRSPVGAVLRPTGHTCRGGRAGEQVQGVHPRPS